MGKSMAAHAVQGMRPLADMTYRGATAAGNEIMGGSRRFDMFQMMIMPGKIGIDMVLLK